MMDVRDVITISPLGISKTKNVRPDTLDLQVPIWISDASFVEGYEDKLFVTSSKYGDFCVYDIRSGQRRPVSRSAWRISRKLGKKTIGTGHNPAMLRDLAVTRPITRCIAYTSGPGTGLRAVAGNAIGDICLLDFRVPHVSLVRGSEAESRKMAPSVGSRAAAPPERVQTFSPAVGAISGLVCGGAGCANLPHLSVFAGINDQPVVMSSSIDRFFRVYNRDSGELLAKIFAKTPISTFLIRNSAEFPMNAQAGSPKSTLTGAARETPGSVSEEEFDEIWDNMQPAAQQWEPPVKRPKNVKNTC
ncbi:unnamed protein product [Mesocestoides corti]|uniref:WD repeat-containing protein 74 n=2 Tax=Mesocestoides corti TaxID=53468 RepID=A0A0R3U5N0_MESCO|nr:unnamed protein product [Mesocestoides corti]